MARIGKAMGRHFAGAGEPLLVSVRSGARVSMPGMMDTVLNLGLSPEKVEALAEATGNPRFAWDSYRRFVSMFGDVVLGLCSADHNPFESILEKEKKKAKEAPKKKVAKAEDEKKKDPKKDKKPTKESATKKTAKKPTSEKKVTKAANKKRTKDKEEEKEKNQKSAKDSSKKK